METYEMLLVTILIFDLFWAICSFAMWKIQTDDISNRLYNLQRNIEFIRANIKVDFPPNYTGPAGHTNMPPVNPIPYSGPVSFTGEYGFRKIAHYHVYNKISNMYVGVSNDNYDISRFITVKQGDKTHIIYPFDYHKYIFKPIPPSENS